MCLQHLYKLMLYARMNRNVKWLDKFNLVSPLYCRVCNNLEFFVMHAAFQQLWSLDGTCNITRRMANNAQDKIKYARYVAYILVVPAQANFFNQFVSFFCERVFVNLIRNPGLFNVDQQRLNLHKNDLWRLKEIVISE